MESPEQACMDVERYARTRLLAAPSARKLLPRLIIYVLLLFTDARHCRTGALPRGRNGFALPLLQKPFQRNGHRARAVLPHHSVAR